MVQWLGPHVLTPEGLGLTPGWGTKISPCCVTQPGKKKKKKVNKFYSINFNLSVLGSQLPSRQGTAGATSMPTLPLGSCDPQKK